MAHMDVTHAKANLPHMDNVQKLLNKEKGWLTKMIEQFNQPGLGFVQTLAANGPNKQLCHDMSQKMSDLNGRVS